MLDKVWTLDAEQSLFYIAAFFGFVPKEILSLGLLFTKRLCTEYRFQGIGIISGVPCFSAYGHGGRSEILNLFQMEVHGLCFNSQFSHVCFRASRMAADEVRDYLLMQVFLSINVIKYLFELLELCE